MDLREKINRKEAVVGVVGLGYVGLPLLLEFSSRGLRTMGFDHRQNPRSTLWPRARATSNTSPQKKSPT